MICKGVIAAFIATVALVGAATAAAAAPNTWTAANPLSAARGSHVAAPLPGGKVLVAGGTTDGSSCLTSAEIYTPATNTWTPAASMGSARCGAAAVALSGGKVLVAGGGTSATNPATGFNTGEVYDPAANSWTAVSNTMSSYRFLHPVAVVMANGQVLIAGGVDHSANALKTADVYNPATNSFAATNSMGTGRAFASAVLLSTGSVLVAGGTTGSPANTPSSTGEVYNPTSASWTPVTGSTSQPRAGASAAALPGGKALIAGGAMYSISGSTETAQGESSTDIYNASTNSFTPGPAMATARSNFGIAPLAGGRVVVGGGFTTLTVNFMTGTAVATPTSSSEVYDAASNTWTTAGPQPTAVIAPTFTALSSGQVLSAGGTGSDTHTGSNEAALFTPAPLPTPPGPSHLKPKLKITGLHKHIKRKRLLRRGLKFTLKPNEAVKLRITLLARGKHGRKFKVTLAKKTFKLSANKRTVVLKLKRKRFRHVRRKVLEVMIVARDATGSKTTTIRKIKVSG
jgi:N-acetylneuraminic acid mutarotase